MLSMFLIEMYKCTGDEKYMEDCIREVTAHAEKLRDPRSGLWWHGWASTTASHDDGCCECGWNGKPHQRNSEFWGRGNGWIAMALADLLSVMPESHSQYKTILAWYRQMMDRLCRLQNRDSGHWMQLPARINEKSDKPGDKHTREKHKEISNKQDHEKGDRKSKNFIES